MLHSWWKGHRDAYSLEHRIHYRSPSSSSSNIAKSNGNSVFNIRNLILGDKLNETWKLPHYRRKSSSTCININCELKEQKNYSFRENFKKVLLKNWAKTPRYSSTPNLNKKDHEKMSRNSIIGSNLNENVNVQRMIQDFETANNGIPCSKRITLSVNSDFVDLSPSDTFSCSRNFKPYTENSLPKSLIISSRLDQIDGQNKSVSNKIESLNDNPFSKNPNLNAFDLSFSQDEDSSKLGASFNEACKLFCDEFLKNSGQSENECFDGDYSEDTIYNDVSIVSNSSNNCVSSINNDSNNNNKSCIINSPLKCLHNFSFPDNGYGFQDCTTEIDTKDAHTLWSKDELDNVNIPEFFENHPATVNAEVFSSDMSSSFIDQNISNGEITVFVQEPGRFLARWVPVEDLSTRDCDFSTSELGSNLSSNDATTLEDETQVSVDLSIGSMKSGGDKTRRPSERRESGRFQSAAKIIRSLRRNNKESSSENKKESLVTTNGSVSSSTTAVVTENDDIHLNRANFHYHSEGKANRKRKMNRSLSNCIEPIHKERSKSFCEKPDPKITTTTVKENINPNGGKTNSLFAHRNYSSPYLCTTKVDENCVSSCHLEPHLSEISPTSKPSKLKESIDKNLTPEHLIIVSADDGIADNFPLSDACTSSIPDANVVTNNEKRGSSKNFLLQRDRERRKLTKDSGYETSPYSEGDYTNIDNIYPLQGTDKLVSTEVIPSPSGYHDTSTRNASIVTNELPAPRNNSEETFAVGSSVDEVAVDSLENSDAKTVDRLGRSDPSGDGPLRSPTSASSSSLESLTEFAESLVLSSTSPFLRISSSSVNLAASSTPSLPQHAGHSPFSTHPTTEDRSNALTGSLYTSKSTPNLEETDVDDECMMVANKISMYPSHSTSPPPVERNDRSRPPERQFWDTPICSEDSLNQSDYAHHLRSSSYQLLHSRQFSSSSFTKEHCRHHSNVTDLKSSEDITTHSDFIGQSHHDLALRTSNLAERSRCFSVDSLGSDGKSQPVHNISEPDLSVSLSSPSTCLSKSHDYEKGKVSPSSALPLTSKKLSCKSTKLPASPPPPPVRDASSLKYIRYGPGHEKFPSWPVSARATNLVLPPNATDSLDPEAVEHSDITGAYFSSSYGSHRSHSWTEQSEYPKEKCAGYARPLYKRQFSPSFQRQLLTVMEGCEKIPPEMFATNGTDDILRNSSYSLIDNYLQYPMYYPLYDREGRGIDDKDYNIPSPPERDPGMGEAYLSHMTVAQLEEHARRCDFAYGEYALGDFPQITPLLDQLRQESYTWDGASERDSGRGDSEALTDSRYSNGRESVTTVVTNSSSASSSETLKWHGSLSDVSIMSGYSRDSRNDQNIAHSARVQTPQRQNSESVFYYGRGKYISPKNFDVRLGKDGSHSRSYKDWKWTREVEKINEANNLRKFPSYCYTQPLSQISESPLAESRETALISKSPKSPVVDNSQQPSVAERINELERQSRSTSFNDISNHCQRDKSEPRDNRKHRESHQRERSVGGSYNSKMHNNIREKDSATDAHHHKTDIRNSGNLSMSGNCLKLPSSLPAKHSRSFSRKESNDSIISSDSSLLSYNESEKASSNTSYTYLDPKKRCKVPDATLKNIQKQALLSFYERRMGKSFSGSTAPSYSPAQTSNSRHPEWASRSFRSERKSPKTVKGLAKLGRVPDSEKDLLNGGESLQKCPVGERGEPQNDSNSESSPRCSNLSSGSLIVNGTGGISHVVEDNTENNNENTERDSSLPRISHDLSSVCKPKELSNQSNKEDVLTFSVSSTEVTSLKPPERPPKKPSVVRPLPFSSFSELDNKKNDSPQLSSRIFYYRKPPAPDPPISPPKSPTTSTSGTSESASAPSTTTTASKVFLQSSSAQVDAPSSSVVSHKDLQTVTSSRSSTPDLPLPPPPPSTVEGEVVTSDEPFPPPPPPTEVAGPEVTALLNGSHAGEEGMKDDKKEDLKITNSEHSSTTSQNIHIQHNGTYHKESYLAHRKDWKSGYEGRYRRMHSPTASDRNNSVVNGRNREHLNNLNNIKNTQSASKPLSCKRPTGFHINGNLRSAVSTSSLLHRPSSPTDKELISDTFNGITINNNNTISNNNIQSNGWAILPHQKSTTVNFTADELRAFKARKAAHEGSISSTGGDSNRSSPLSSNSHSPMRPLSRAFSMGEPLHKVSDECELSLSIKGSRIGVDSSRSSPPVIHDGPVVAHPATVTEEITTPPSTPPRRIQDTSSPVASEKFDGISSLQRTLSSPLSISISTSLTAAHSSSSSSTSTLTSSSHSSMTSLSTLSASASTLVSSSLSSSSLTLNMSSVSNGSSSASAVTGHHLPSTGTSPSMAPLDLSALDETVPDRSNIVILSYGRMLKPEVIDCDKLSTQFVIENGNTDGKLQALLASGPKYKSMANYMNGIFTLELRKDLLNYAHANHPDLRTEANRGSDKRTNSPPCVNSLIMNGNCSTDGKEVKLRPNEREQSIPIESFSLSTSEAKAKLLSKIRSNHEGGIDAPYLNPQYLKKKKEELIKCINRKLEILKSEEVIIRQEICQNTDLGLKITAKIETRAKPSEVNKFKLHAEEIDKIASLLLGLSNRLAKAENSLLILNEKDMDGQKRVLESKRDKLKEQLEEAKKLKENIDRRAIQISRTLSQYLNTEEYADYDHFIKMKAKLIMDKREIEDRISIGEEQLEVLLNNNNNNSLTLS